MAKENEIKGEKMLVAYRWFVMNFPQGFTEMQNKEISRHCHKNAFPMVHSDLCVIFVYLFGGTNRGGRYEL